MTDLLSRLSARLPPALARFPWVTVGWIFAAATAVLLALYVIVVGQLLSVLEERRAEAATWLGARMGMVAEIGRLEGEMDFLTPVVHMRGVRFYVRDMPRAADTVPALAVPTLDLEIDTLSSLLARRPILKQLRVVGLDLVLEQDDDGRFRIRGMPFNVNDPQAAEKLRQALLAIYQQTDILVERSRLTVQSAQLPVTALEKVRLHMHNDGDEHAVSGSVQVVGPDKLSASFVMRFSGEPVVPRDLVADLYLRVLPTSIEDWMPRRDLGDLWLDSLSGGGELWLRLENARVASLTGRAQIDSLAVSMADGRKLEGLLGLSTRFRWQAQADGWTLAFGGLTFRRKGDTWPETDGAFDVRRDAAGNLRLHAALSRGDLDMLAGFAEALPAEQAELRARIAALAPEGRLTDFHIDWDAAAAPDARWRLASGFSGVALRTDGALPGLGGISGRVEAAPDAGYVALTVADTKLDVPTVFSQALRLDEARLRAVWRRNAGGWQVMTDRFTLKNPDARASGLLTLRLPADDSSPRLSLLGMLEDGNAKKAPQYLPHTMSETARNWLREALAGGHLRRGSFLHEGPLRRDAESRRERTFQTRWQGDGITLSFLPGWPALRSADADVFVRGGRVEVRGQQGRLLGSVVRDMRVSIVTPPTPANAAPDAPPPFPQLEVQAQVDGDVADAFTLFRDTPLKDVVPAELLRWNGNGRLAAGVRVSSLPGSGKPPHVVVEGTVAGTTLNSAAHALEVSDVSGELRYDTVAGFFARNLRGHALDGDFTGSARTVSRPAGGSDRQVTTVDFRGPLHMAPLSAWLKLPALDLLRGDTTAALQLRFERGSNSVLEVRSDLRGIAASAPAPLAKNADSAIDTRLSYTLGTDTPRLALVYGRNFAADMQLRGGAPETGAVVLGSTRLPQPGVTGLVIEGSVPSLVLADWLAFSRRLAGLPAVPDKAPFTVSRAVSGIVALGNTVQRINVAAAKVDAGGFPLEDAQLQMGREGEGWLLRVDSRALDGQVLLPDGYQERGEKPLVMQIDSFALAGGAATKFAAVDPLPGTIPRLDLTLKNLSVGGESYGNWSLKAVPDGNGVQLLDVHGDWRALEIAGQGRWAPTASDGARTQFSGTAKAADVARVSEAFGFAPNLSSSQAKIDFDLDWPGSPVRVDPLKMRGVMSLDLSDGRFVTQSAKTQALRAFGVFNINTWQRRLKLNFSDLYKKGVAFDTLTGDLALDNGQVSTENLVVKGPSALFELSGHTDLSSHAIGGHLRVTLPVNSNLYVGCLAGLPACAGIVVAERLWGDKLEKMTTLAYDVSGVWEDPKITQLEGTDKQSAPAPAAGDAPAADGKTGANADKIAPPPTTKPGTQPGTQSGE